MFNMLQLLLRIRCICLSPAVFSDVLALPIFKQEDSSLPSENETKNPPFQYVLCTATSPAVKLHDETLTYLNQGERQCFYFCCVPVLGSGSFKQSTLWCGAQV